MFEKKGSFLLRSSASALSHNLDVFTAQEQVKAAVIHKSNVNVLFWNADKGGPQKTYLLQAKNASGAKTDVFQVKWCQIGQVPALVIITQDGFQIYDDTGTQMHFWYHFENEGWFGTSLAVLEKDQLAIGTSTGKIAIFNLGQRCDAVQAENLDTGFNSSVSTVTASSRYLACGGDNGNIGVWQSKSPYGKLQSFDTYGFPCTGICLWNDWVLVAYGSGHLRLFDIVNRQILSEITAHAKWISALDISESSSYALSVSEDSFLRVWQLSKSQEDVVVN